MAMINAVVFHCSKIIRRTTTRSCFHALNVRCCSQSTKDYYEILGVSKSASKRQIRTAFLQLSKKHHPDVNPRKGGSSEEFKKVSEAYKVLSNTERKREYDYNILRREDPSMPPAHDVNARFYQDRTIYRGPKIRRDTGYTNSQVVMFIVGVATVAAFAQVIRARVVARRRAELEAEDEDQAMEDMERIQNNAFVSRTRLLQRLVEAKEAEKLAKKKSSTDVDSLTDKTPDG